MTNKLLGYLDYLFPDPRCELFYQTDYQLLMAVVLSAQSTDKRVNSVTPIIFSKYPTLEDLKNAKLEDLKKQGVTIVIVTHDIDKITSFCDRAIWIKDGQISYDGSPNIAAQKYLKETPS